MKRNRKSTRNEGTALVVALLVTMVIAALSFGMSTVTHGSYAENREYAERTRVFYIAEAGMNEAIAILTSRGKDAMKAESYPKTLGAVGYAVTVTFGDESPHLADDLIQVVATANERQHERRIETMLQITGTNGGRYNFGAFGDRFLAIDSNSAIDAWNSENGGYPDQIAGKTKSMTYALQDTKASSNGTISLASNSYVFGDATPGPGMGVSAAKQAVIAGSTSPATEPVVLPTIDVPNVPTLLPLLASKGTLTLPSGTFGFSTLKLESNSKLTITGPATIVVGDFKLLSNSSILVDATNGPVEFYVKDGFELNSNTEFRSLTSNPQDIAVNYTGTSQAVFNSNTGYWGAFIAPNAEIDMRSNGRVYGVIGGKSLLINSGSRVHVDHALMGAGGSTGNGQHGLQLAVLSWRPY